MAIPNIWAMLVEPVTKIFTTQQERKIAKESAKAKLAMAKHAGDQEVILMDKEWEALGKASEDNSWKDEYITIIITLPIPAILVGAIYYAFTGDDRLLAGVNQGISELKNLGLNMGDLMYIVVLAGVGIKAYKSR